MDYVWYTIWLRIGIELATRRDKIEAAHATIPDTAWTLDAHGDPDWRRAVALVLAQQIRRELA